MVSGQCGVTFPRVTWSILAIGAGAGSLTAQAVTSPSRAVPLVGAPSRLPTDGGMTTSLGQPGAWQ